MRLRQICEDLGRARDAVCAAFGPHAPNAGTVTAYVLDYDLPQGLSGLAALVSLTDFRGNTLVALKREMALSADRNVEDVLLTTWAEIGDGSMSADPFDGGPGDKLFHGLGLRIMRIIANSILYLSSSNPDIIDGLREPPKVNGIAPSSKDRRRFERHVTSLGYSVVGSHAAAYRDPVDPSGKKLDHRIKVRGHWKSQAHGPGLKERKHIHIEPYWKGPEAAEVINRTYVVS